MDGTQVDTEATNLAIVEKGLAAHGISLSPKEQEAYPGSTIKGFSQKILENHNVDDAEAKAQAISDSKLTEFPKLLKEGKINSFPKICNLAQVLKQQGFKIALVTSSMREVMNDVLTHFKLNGYFNIKLGREDADGNLKPCRARSWQDTF